MTAPFSRFNLTPLVQFSFYTRCFKVLIVTFIYLTVAGKSISQSISEKGFPRITNYPPELYDASTQNWCITEDVRGVKYFGNQTGILEFDGTHWRKIKSANNSVAPVKALAKDSHGRIYYGAYGDIGYLAPDSFGVTRMISLLTHVPAADRDFSDIWTVCVKDNKVYFQSREKIIELLNAGPQGNETWKAKVWQPETSFMYAFLLDEVYYVHQQNSGLLRMTGDKLSIIPGSEFTGRERVQVMLPVKSNKNQSQFLVGLFFSGLYLYDGHQFSPFKTEADALLKSGQILYRGQQLKDGSYALSTVGNGLLLITEDGKLTRQINRASGLQDESVYGTYEDKNGLLWIALDNGISKVDIQSALSYFSAFSGINSSPLSIKRFNGSLYLGTSNGLMQYDPQELRFSAVAGLPGTQIFDLHTELGQLLIPGNGLFLVENPGATAKEISLSESLTLTSLYTPEKHPDILLGGGGFGIAVFRRQNSGKRGSDKFDFIGYLPGIEYPVWTFAKASDDFIWAGTQNGVVYRISLSYDPEGNPSPANSIVELFDEQHGLHHALGSVYNVNSNAYFISDSGIFRFDEQKKIFERDSIFGQFKNGGGNQDGFLAEDETGKVWIKFGKEIRLAIPEKNGQYKILKKILPELAKTTVNFIYPEKNGIVWFCTASNLIRYNHNEPKTDEGIFPVFIRQARAGKKLLNIHHSLKTDSGNKIEFSNNNLRFDYISPDFGNDAETPYQTYLQGFEEGWSEPDVNTYKEYTNLPPGKYAFHVRAVNPHGNQNEEDVFHFTIATPWYRTWLALLAYFLLGIGVTYLIVRFRTRHLLAREKKLTEIYKVAEKFVPFEFIRSLGHNKITDINLGDHVERNVTVLFSDIRNYTSISEQMTPEENFQFVQEFQLIMGPIIRKNNGFVNQFLGDAIMAIFPDQATDALTAAVEMQKALKDSGIFGTTENRSALSMGIGLHTGPIIMGIIGDSDRLEPATISDTANTASRIESLTKFYKCEILISDTTFRQVSDQARYLRSLGPIQLKGKREIFTIYECFGSNSADQVDLKFGTLPLFNEAYEHFRNKSFDLAINLLLRITKENPFDHTAQHILDKIIALKKTGVPMGWTGVEEMSEK